jgi:hypothetical protein
MPLPDGATFNITTGEFTFTPRPRQVGDIPLSFLARTAGEEVSESITVTVPAAVPGAPTRMRGRVFDASRDGVRRVEAIDTTLNGLPQAIVSDIRYRGEALQNRLPRDPTVGILTDYRITIIW